MYMDEFAKEYFRKITKVNKDFTERRRELAESRIKMFAASTYRQLADFNEDYNLILGAGNSGLFMTKLTKIVYESLSIKLPLVLNLPIYRFKEDKKIINNNSFLIPQVKKELNNLDIIDNVLFVDDEIMRALTAKECFNLLLEAKPEINHLNATIIAENHFFEWHYKMPKVSISFFAYAPLIQGFNGNIGHFIPDDLHKEVLSVIGGSLSYNQTMAIVIGGGLKRKDKHSQYFDYSLEEKLKSKISNYDDRKNSLINRLQELIKEGIEEYKTGKIKFRF